MSVRAALLAVGATQLAVAAWMVADPASFFDHVGGFGARNDHYLRDVATWYAALGAAAVVAAARPAWRVPVLALALVQYALHAVNHVADADLAVGATDGTLDAVVLALGAVTLAALLGLAVREREQAP